MKPFIITLLIVSGFACDSKVATKKQAEDPTKPFTVIAYYSGNEAGIDGYNVSGLTHIIFSFCHLKGARLNVDNARDTATILKLVSLKKLNPSLKILFSLGGWGGCATCSPVFADSNSRKDFARSVKELCDHFKVDGIDLDWEYPAIEGYPGHAYMPSDKSNFTSLIKILRDELGSQREISFAAGGFTKFIKESIDWSEVMPLIDRVNLMSYDLVGGYSKVTGHHTPLYSNSLQVESADRGIRYLDSLGVPLNKIVIGAAFYARTWEKVPNTDNGLYKPGTFKDFVAYHRFENTLNEAGGFIFFRDSIAAAPYAYNPKQKVFATFDDPFSIEAKTRYVMNRGLNGIMFWELSLDKKENGLLAVIVKTLAEGR
jgi:chitinase